MNEFVAMVHRAEDKYRPIGEYPSVNFIPENSTELKQIREKLQHDDMAEATEKIREGIKTGMTKREMSRKYQISFTKIRQIIEANHWESKVVKERRKTYSMFNAKGKLIDRGTVTDLSKKHDVAKNAIYSSAWAVRSNSGKMAHMGNYFTDSDAMGGK